MDERERNEQAKTIIATTAWGVAVPSFVIAPVAGNDGTPAERPCFD